MDEDVKRLFEELVRSNDQLAEELRAIAREQAELRKSINGMLARLVQRPTRGP